MQKNKELEFTSSVVALPLFFVLALWVVFWIEIRFNLRFTEYCIYPRTFTGLRGVLFSPFLHGDSKHLYNNSISLIFLLGTLRYFFKKESFQIVIYGILLSGFLTWLIGRSSYHIGASGLIYVLVSFIFFKGMMIKHYQLMALSLVMVFFYGGLIWYTFLNPTVEKGISWEVHLSGFITGFVLAALYKTATYKKLIQYDWEHPDFNPHLDPFMRHFDENGNFIQFPEQNSTGIQEVSYDFKASKKEK